ncbi:PBECR2 nuclease fold domain-containing protein [Pseudomonas sp. NPDC088429]|jgi:hypothetical protein|uniref:PBECR2 nuclease fold domain-containing protein n=1 Tax=unclassified Pseudomonas TaxID=196821 RepID=UPI00155D9351|nr:PBECR2 nuclease fold domain-containing protein [Pseudomonas sp. P1.31]
MNLPGKRATPNQTNWIALGLPDIRDIEVRLLNSNAREIPGATSLELAWEQVALGFGLSEGKSYSVIQTPYVAVTVRREYLLHIVEKRPNARERFTEFALDTIQNPLEIWQISYDDGSIRLAFIGAYDTKYQMLVVIHADYGHALWNFMNCDKKALNKHRHGILVYQRFQTAKQKKQPEEAAFSEVGA